MNVSNVLYIFFHLLIFSWFFPWKEVHLYGTSSPNWSTYRLTYLHCIISMKLKTIYGEGFLPKGTLFRLQTCRLQKNPDIRVGQKKVWKFQTIYASKDFQKFENLTLSKLWKIKNYKKKLQRCRIASSRF